MRKKLLIIVNPAAGRCKGNKIGAEIDEMYTQAGWDTRRHDTMKAGDAAHLVRTYAHRADMIVCVGGDGTLSEMLSGLLRVKNAPPLCYVPLGSTNDLAFSVGLPKNPMNAARCGLSGRAQHIDAGRFNNTIFSYVACFGAFSRTSYITGRQMKNKLGHFAYILTGAKELNSIRPYPVRIELEDEVIQGDFLFGAVCNTRSLGRALKIPVAEGALCDGQHELLLVREPKSILQALSCLWSIASGRYDHELLVIRRISSATFHMPEDMPWSLDGERADAGRDVQVETLKHAYRLMLP